MRKFCVIYTYTPVGGVFEKEQMAHSDITFGEDETVCYESVCRKLRYSTYLQHHTETDFNVISWNIID